MKDKSTGINEGDLQGSIYHATRMFKENLMRVTDGRTKLINLFLDVNIKRYADGNLEEWLRLLASWSLKLRTVVLHLGWWWGWRSFCAKKTKSVKAPFKKAAKIKLTRRLISSTVSSSITTTAVTLTAVNIQEISFLVYM